MTFEPQTPLCILNYLNLTFDFYIFWRLRKVWKSLTCDFAEVLSEHFKKLALSWKKFWCILGCCIIMFGYKAELITTTQKQNLSIFIASGITTTYCKCSARLEQGENDVHLCF